mgnify:FL=1
MKKILFFTFYLLFTFSYSQIKDSINNDVKLSSLPYYNYGKGLGITSADSLFQLNIRFRIQNRITYIKNDDEDAAYQGEIRRLRLRFDGYVGNPKFLYVIQLSFAPGDVGEIEEGENINIIRDAAVFYRHNKHWNFLFGQTKLPGNRQRVNSSGALQFTDRTINNARFNIDRDFGFQANYFQNNKDNFSYNIRTAVSTGEGRNWTKSADNGVAFTGKLELLPFGTFKKDGVYFEGDLAREPKPKLMLSGTFHQNNLAKRTQGQLGDDLFEEKTMKSVLLDAILKYNGFSLMTSYMNRTAKNPIAINPLNNSEFNYVYVGSGTDFQGSYMFKNHYEIIARYSNQKVHEDIFAFTPNTKQYSLGVTKYIWEHAFKIQAEVTKTDLSYINNTNKENWYVRFQIEMGI